MWRKGFLTRLSSWRDEKASSHSDRVQLTFSQGLHLLPFPQLDFDNPFCKCCRLIFFYLMYINDHISRCPNLLSLTLSGCGHVTDYYLTLLLKCCPNLKILKLENCVRITDQTLEAVTNYGGSLHTLHVDFCRNITHAGLEEVRKKHPSVMLKAEKSASMIPDCKPEEKLVLERMRRKLVQQ